MKQHTGLLARDPCFLLKVFFIFVIWYFFAIVGGCFGSLLDFNGSLGNMQHWKNSKSRQNDMEKSV